MITKTGKIADTIKIENTTENADTISQRGWKTAMMKFLGSFGFTHAITLAWNRGVGLDRARDDLKQLMRKVDQRLVGSRFNKVPSEHRTKVLFAFEGYRHHHVHVHSLWKAPIGKWFKMGQMFHGVRGGVWNEVVPTGTCDTVTCSPNGSDPEITGYILKEQHRFSDSALMVWSDEFHPSR